MDINIVAISGCLSHNSVASGLIRACLLAQHPHVKIQIADVSQFPLVNPDIIAEKGFPESVQIVRNMVSQADGVIVAFPNHNSLVSAVMKNAYDWISINDGACPVKQKPFAMMCSSEEGKTDAIEHFKRVGKYCKLKICEKYVNVMVKKGQNVDEKGNISDQQVMNEVISFVDSFYQMILSNKQ